MSTSYDEDTLITAISAIQNESLTLRQASEKYNIPRSTLSDKIRLKYKTNERGMHL